MHVGARYCDAQVGRFITRDTVLTEHPYIYCEHDPVNAVDPTGHFSLYKFLAEGIPWQIWVVAVGIAGMVDTVTNPKQPGDGFGLITGGGGAVVSAGGGYVLAAQAVGVGETVGWIGAGTTVGAVGGAVALTGGIVLIGAGVAIGVYAGGRYLGWW